MICPAPLLPLLAPKQLAPLSTPQRRLLRCGVLGVVAHVEYISTLTAARRVKAAVSKSAW